MLVRLAVLLWLGIAAPARAVSAYRPAGSVPLGMPDRWGYVVADPASGRVYIAHGDRVTDVDGRAGRVVGAVAGIAGGAHGTGILGRLGLGVTDDGRAGTALVFDLRTLAVRRRIAAGVDADAVAIDPATGHALVSTAIPARSR